MRGCRGAGGPRTGRARCASSRSCWPRSSRRRALSRTASASLLRSPLGLGEKPHQVALLVGAPGGNRLSGRQVGRGGRLSGKVGALLVVRQQAEALEVAVGDRLDPRDDVGPPVLSEQV